MAKQSILELAPVPSAHKAVCAGTRGVPLQHSLALFAQARIGYQQEPVFGARGKTEERLLQLLAANRARAASVVLALHEPSDVAPHP